MHCYMLGCLGVVAELLLCSCSLGCSGWGARVVAMLLLGCSGWVC